MDQTRFGLVLRYLFLSFAGALALLWPAVVNGGPFWFPDTTNYIRGADAAVVYITGHHSEWSDRLVEGPRVHPGSKTSLTGLLEIDTRVRPTRPVYSGRSIYYGFLLYLPMLVAGVWGGLFVQALVTSSVLLFLGRLLGREFGGVAPWSATALFLILVIATPLPFYVTMLMPDIYAGLLILTLLTAITFFPRLSRGERWTLLSLSALFATFHTTHILIAAVLTGLALLLQCQRGRWLILLKVGVPVITIGVASIVLFNSAVQVALRERPFSPPFLTARLTSAGPGTEYLDRHCTAKSEPFHLCRHRGRLPLESDEFLWSKDPQRGLFALLSPEEQRLIASEDTKFFLATLAYDPHAFAMAALASWKCQLFSFDFKNFNYSGSRADELFQQYPPRVARHISRTRAAAGQMPVTPFVWLSIISTIGALALLAAVALRSIRTKVSLNPGARRFALLVVLGVAANAAICGTLSGPHARYQMRLIWIIPFAAIMVAPGARRAAANSPATRQSRKP